MEPQLAGVVFDSFIEEIPLLFENDGILGAFPVDVNGGWVSDMSLNAQSQLVLDAFS